MKYIQKYSRLMLMMDDTNTQVLNMLITCMKFLEFLIMLQYQYGKGLPWQPHCTMV